MKKCLQIMRERLAVYTEEKPHIWIRLFVMAAGLSLCSFCVGFFRIAIYGMDPFQSLLSGLESAFPKVPFEVISLICYAVLIIADFFLDRKLIGPGTVFMMLTSGSIIAFSHRLLSKLFGSADAGLRMILLLTGVVVMCFAASFYTAADMGVTAYDAMPLGISHRIKNIPFRIIRIISDSFCIISGLALFFLVGGGTWDRIGVIAGIGTVLSAFLMGPLIQLFYEKISLPVMSKVLGRKEGEKNGSL